MFRIRLPLHRQKIYGICFSSCLTDLNRSRSRNTSSVSSAQKYLRHDHELSISCREQQGLFPVYVCGDQQLHSTRFYHTKISVSNNGSWKVVYEGPLSRAVKRVKLFSLSTAAASMVGCPVLVFFGKQSVPFVGKLAIAGLLGIVGTATTLFLHGFTRSYVHKAYFHLEEQKFAVETLSLFARLKRTEFHVDDVAIPEMGKMFSTFEAAGRRYFIHEELIEAQQILQFVRDHHQDKQSVTSDITQD